MSWHEVDHVNSVTSYDVYRRDPGSDTGQKHLVERKRSYLLHGDHCDPPDGEAACAYSVAAQTREVRGGRSQRVRCFPDEEFCIWNGDETCSEPPKKDGAAAEVPDQTEAPDPAGSSLLDRARGLVERVFPFLGSRQDPQETPAVVEEESIPQAERPYPEPDPVACTPERVELAKEAERKAREAARREDGELPEEGSKSGEGESPD